MRLSVDAGQCMGHGRCVRILPDLLDFDDEGYVTIRGQTVDIPDDLTELAAGRRRQLPGGRDLARLRVTGPTRTRVKSSRHQFRV